MINQAILNRRSVRTYSDQPVSEEIIKEIIKAAQFSPTAMNNRSWEFLVIKGNDQKEKLCNIACSLVKQESIKKAPVVLIPVINTKVSVLPVQDLSIASENIFIQVVELGLGSFWKNITPDEAEKIKEAFNIPADFTLINVIPLGYPAQEINPHTDEEFIESKIHSEKW
jgi:nitroreductase